MLGPRARAIMDEIAECLAEYADVIERPGMESVSILLKLDSAGVPHTDHLRPEFKRRCGARRRREAA